MLSPTLGLSKTSYRLEDVRGESKACEKSLRHKSQTFEKCDSLSPDSAENISRSFLEIDRGRAVSEIKANIKTMAESQIEASIQQLQQVGAPISSVQLQARLKDLSTLGYRLKPPMAVSADEALSEKYLLASLRYHELRKLSANQNLNAIDRKSLKERLELLEARYPLLAEHSFSKLSTQASALLKASTFIPKESADESLMLDNYLFNNTPAKISELKLDNFKATSAIGQMAKALSQNSNPRITSALQDILKEDLQASLSDQLKALTKLESFDTCQTMTLHSTVSLQAINSSTHPEDVFAQYCECQKLQTPVPESALMVGGLVAGAAGLLCVVPTGIGQVIACPTAVAVGWGTAGGSAVNFTSQLSRYNSFQDQGTVLKVLENGAEKKPELELLSRKSSELSREMVNDNMVGLIGVGVGHVGFTGLAKLYTKSRISGSLSKLSVSERKKVEDTLKSLNKEDQTKLFVVLDKLDDESRAVLLQNPSLLNRELKGLRCEI